MKADESDTSLIVVELLIKISSVIEFDDFSFSLLLADGEGNKLPRDVDNVATIVFVSFDDGEINGDVDCEVWGKTDCSADAVDVKSMYSKGVGCEDWVEIVEVLGCSGDVRGESWVEVESSVNVGDVGVELDDLVGGV